MILGLVCLVIDVSDDCGVVGICSVVVVGDKGKTGGNGVTGIVYHQKQIIIKLSIMNQLN